MSTQVQHRRGTSTQHESFVGAMSEITHDTTSNNIRVHDGQKPGGHATVMEDQLGVAGGVATLDATGNVPEAQLGNAPKASDYASVATVEAAEIREDVLYLRTAGFSVPGDGGAALYKRVSSEPSHADKLQSADGAWWELSRDIINGTTIGGQFDDEPYLGIIGGAHFGDATANDDPRGYSHGFFRRTGDTTLDYGNNLRVMTMIESSISHVENAGYFGIIQSTASTGTDSDIVATVSTAVKSASALGSDTSLWGANPLVIDQTNRKSSVSGANAFLRGLETNVSAGGPDDNNRRIGHDVIMFHLMGYPDSIDGPTSHYCGQRVTTSAGINSSLGDVTVKYAYISDPSPTPASTKGHIEVGYLAQDSSNVGFLAKGAAPASGAFRAEITGGGAEIYLVSDQKADGSVVAGETYVGLNSANGGVIYGQIRQQIGSSATGSEQGYWYLSQMLNGVKTDVLAAIGSGPNPIFIYVNGALKQVTVGAADSGGAGYRVLRVNN